MADESLASLLEALSARRAQGVQPEARRPPPPVALPAVRPSSHRGLRQALREASRRTRRRPAFRRLPRGDKANVKVASPRGPVEVGAQLVGYRGEFNPVLVLHEPAPHPWDAGRWSSSHRSLSLFFFLLFVQFVNDSEPQSLRKGLSARVFAPQRNYPLLGLGRCAVLLKSIQISRTVSTFGSFGAF